MSPLPNSNGECPRYLTVTANVPVTRQARAGLERMARSIVILTGRREPLDADLAVLYGVATARLNQQVRRNLERFPGDFMFQLSAEEHAALKLQHQSLAAADGASSRSPSPSTAPSWPPPCSTV